MSWNASLIVEVDGHAFEAGDWNFTHNTNGMVDKVLDTVKPTEHPDSWYPKMFGRCWWGELDGLSAPESVKFLELIIGGLSEAPEFFRSMNPENGWGDYDSLVHVLAEMRSAAEEYPSATWSASG